MKELTIVGRGDSWKECKFSTSELWGCATCLVTEGMEDKPYTKVFAFDSDVDEELNRALGIARSRNIPIVSQRPYATEPFDQIQIAMELGSSYWMPTISYTIAYAIHLGYEKIYIDGIDAGKRWDYQSGKPHIVFWLGYATAMWRMRGYPVLRLGVGSLRWAYLLGLSDFPQAWLELEENSLAKKLVQVEK